MKIFYKINDPEVRKVPIGECGEEMVDIRKESENIFMATEKDYPHIISLPFSSFVRKSVFEKLSQSQRSLPDSIRFKLLEGYRSISIQKKIFEERKERLAKEHPEWSANKLHQETALFIAPWEDTPPHSTGGAIDITLVSENGEELDMGTDMNKVYDDIYDNSCSMDSDVLPETRRNRKLLANSLIKEGFVNYPAEWWHWSYGDRYWALLSKSSHAIYGSAEAIIPKVQL